ncbi:lysoplasmalogenase family protein [Haloplasma contractile]|uniref:Membrane protein n=1 Tax=Haloplasma contractile SSD-17B TaxID=1033810 RepID=U2DY65_9MOLU|nr:lysoplasmalogenase family protein [Haloplasma contractile]ERJ13202.1 Putative membrane protein [Haloplasma contractile SSD-17B]
MNSLKRIKVISFLLISLILYILFIVFPGHVPVKTLKYIGILLCYGYSNLLTNQSVADTWLVRIALFFTVIADYFLLVIGEYVLVGVSVFSIVQILYGVRLARLNVCNIKVSHSILLRGIVITLFQLIGLFTLNHNNLLTLITFFYIANLVTNVMLAIWGYKRNIIFTIGLLLFLCCDLFVGLYNSQDYINITSDSLGYKLLTAPFDVIWLFYYPSQVLITISILANNRYKKVSYTNHKCKP